MGTGLKLKFNFEATGLGSVPFKDKKIASRIILDNFPVIPFWPQLPKRSFLENMYVQFSEGLPGLVLDKENKTIHIDTSKVAADIEKVYGKYLDGDVDFFKISDDHAEGFYEFLNNIPAVSKNIKFLKGQITGPISYALFLTDENKKSVIYDKDLFEVLAKVLVMKAKWQVRRLKKYFPNVIIFIDEPYLVSIGSSYVNVNIENAFEKLNELTNSIKAEGALVGIHCCGNTDWGAILKSRVDILSFDAYNFTKELLLYTDDLKNFLKNGGTIAWGKVPSSEAIDGETRSSLSDKLKNYLKELLNKGIQKENLSSLITPSCGVGTLDEGKAEVILETAKALSKEPWMKNI